MKYKKLLCLLLCAVLFLSNLPMPASGFITEDGDLDIPHDVKVYSLSGQSTNSKTEAEHLFFVGHVMYIIFTVREDKTINSGTFTLDNDHRNFSLTIDPTLYDTLHLHGTLLPHKTASDGTYRWQMAHYDFANEDVHLGGDIIISIETGSGGFNLNNIDYTITPEYGLSATKTLVSINGQPADQTSTAQVGDTLVWEIVVTNVGQLPITGITLTDYLEQTTLSDTSVFNLATGESHRVLATHTVLPHEAGTQIVNVIAAESDEHMIETGSSYATPVDYAVTFHTNLPGVDETPFRIYHTYGTDSAYTLTQENTVSSFYDLPDLGAQHNSYIFKGWYLDQDNENDARPIDWAAAYTENTNIYAHWIHAGTVAQEDDGKLGIPNGAYNGFDLVGTQIRYAVDDEGYYDYSAGQTGANCGLRFIAVLSEDVWSQLLQVHSANPSSAHYGFVMAKTSTAEKYCAGAENYQLQCKDSSANGIDTTATYKYVKNMICTSNQGGEYTGSAISRDHFNGTGYRLYTAVLTYTSQTTPEALAAAQAVEFTARAYLQYTDANGLLRIYYNNYSEPTHRYNGCSASYQTVFNLTQQALEGSN